MVLLWDGLLPAYAPELNPVEYLWANLKGAELANFTGDTMAEVASQAQHSIQRVCDSDSHVVGFLAQAVPSDDARRVGLPAPRDRPTRMVPLCVKS